MTQTFWIEPTDNVQIGLRRYSRQGSTGWTCAEGYHSVTVYTGVAPAEYDNDHRLQRAPDVAHDDPRWPTHCRCGYVFTADDEWQPWQDLIYRRTDTDEIRLLRVGNDGSSPIPAAEPGACLDADWLHYPGYMGPDGITLMVRCPDGHDWLVDSRASNCTLPADDVHKCWVRHGDPRDCHLTVDKNGVTCSAGAGSIQTPSWHGFLRDGQLVT